LADKEAILASLNIKAMEFEEGLLNTIPVQRVVVPTVPLPNTGAFSLLSQVCRKDFFSNLINFLEGFCGLYLFFVISQGHILGHNFLES